jgi:hypothetical protein
VSHDEDHVLHDLYLLQFLSTLSMLMFGMYLLIFKVFDLIYFDSDLHDHC